MSIVTFAHTLHMFYMLIYSANSSSSSFSRSRKFLEVINVLPLPGSGEKNLVFKLLDSSEIGVS